MNIDDPAVLEVLRRSMVARIASLSRNGRPSINSLYFVYLNGRIWLGTSEWTLAARNVQADPRVSVLFTPSCCATSSSAEPNGAFGERERPSLPSSQRG